MDRTSLRWGLLLGGVSAAIGIVSLLIWVALLPLQGSNADATQIVVVILIRAVVRLVFLALALGVAYYGGYRIEQERTAMQGTLTSQRRMDAVLAGGLILLVDWLAQTVFMYATGITGQRGPVLSFVGSQLVFGVICVLFGAGLAGIGARDQASRRVLARFGEPADMAVGRQSVASAPMLTDGEAAPFE